MNRIPPFAPAATGPAPSHGTSCLHHVSTRHPHPGGNPADRSPAGGEKYR